VTFNLELGYQLTGLPYANLGVKLWGIGKDTASGGKSIPVQAGEGVVHVSLTVDTDQLAEGAWAAGADLGTYIDAGPGFAINDLPLFDTQWCVRCEPSQLPTQPAVLGTYWRPQIQAATVGQVAEGYQVSRVSVSPTRLLLHRSGLYPEAALPQTVETEPADLSGLSETTVIPVKVLLPEEAELVGPATVEVTVEITRQP
jgi:YbbR-like protein